MLKVYQAMCDFVICKKGHSMNVLFDDVTISFKNDTMMCRSDVLM